MQKELSFKIEDLLCSIKLIIKMNSSDLALIFTKILYYYKIIKKKKELKSEIFRFIFFRQKTKVHRLRTAHQSF